MQKWSDYYEKLFNFREIRYFDIKGAKTGLVSKAMTAPDGIVRIPLNESSDPKSQINEYLDAYHGEGIQHIACFTDDIYATIEAMRARATVGEVSDALEKVYTRHRATIRSVTGIYGSAYDGDEGFAKIKADVAAFAAEEGRRPRMLVVKLGQDGHDRGAKVIATAFADIGFDVDVGPLFQTPDEAARQAVENDVHVIGVSSQAAGHKTLVPALIEALKGRKADDILVVCGGVIPPQDYDLLLQQGVAAIYGPGTNIPHAAAEVLGLIRRRKRAA
jgi:methylmalonyl-CoA mutase